MKKTCLFIFLFFIQNSTSQEYFFDRLIHYKTTSISFSGSDDLIIFFNSKNTSYYLINRSWNEEMNTFLVDYNLNITHSYINKNIKENNDYRYLYSKRFNPDNCVIDCAKITLDESSNGGQFSKILLSKYTNKKKKKKEYEIEVISKPYDFAVLKPLIKIMEHHFLFCDELIVESNSIPTSSKLIKKGQVMTAQSLFEEKSVAIYFTVQNKDLVFK